MIPQLVVKIERHFLPPACPPSAESMTFSDAATIKDLPYSNSSSPSSSPDLDIEKQKRFAIVFDDPKHDVFNVSNTQRYLLLFVFSLATAIDMLNVSAMLTTTESIAKDMQLHAGNITWMCAHDQRLTRATLILVPQCHGLFNDIQLPHALRWPLGRSFPSPNSVRTGSLWDFGIHARCFLW